MFNKNTAVSSIPNEISDLLAKIHIQIQKELIEQDKKLSSPKKNTFCNILRDLFVPQAYSHSSRIKLLELCRDILRNNTTIQPEYVERFFASAPSDIKAIFKQVKNFSKEDKAYCKQIFNEHGYITLDFINTVKKT